MIMRRTVTTTLSYYSTMSPKLLLGSCVLLIFLAFPSEGWIPIASTLGSVSRFSYASPHHTATIATSSSTKGIGIDIGIGMDTDLMRLDASSSPLPDEIFDDDDGVVDDFSQPSSAPPRTTIYRAACSGVAVSETGFWLMLRVASDQYWPVQVTSTVADTKAATSPEALTLLQLLADVDLAGAILAPEILARIIVAVCDEHDYDDTGMDPKGGNNNSQRIRDLSRIRLPVCTLDEIQYYQQETSSGDSEGGSGGGIWEYQCQVQDVGPQTVIPTCNVLQKVAWSDADPLTATTAADEEETNHEPCGAQAAFFALALALRYKAPISLSLLSESDSHSHLLSHDQVVAQFPLYRSRDKLQETCATVTANIERGLKIHQLQAALQMALQKRDVTAAAKIRVALDELDSLQDLPVQPETDTRNMQ